MTNIRIGSLPVKVILAFAVAVTTTLGHGQTYTDLYNFGSASGDPINPRGAVAQGFDGNLYSTARGGTFGDGSIFDVTPLGTLSSLYSFSSTSQNADNGLTLGSDGNLYGTTIYGGGSTGCFGFGCGMLFRITPDGMLTTLHNFSGHGDGTKPYGPPIQGADSNFYGVTKSGGAHDVGTIYKLTPAGKLITLYSFSKKPGHGYAPTAPLIQGRDGNFYGTTSAGGKACCFGTVFKITPSGKFTSLYDFDSTHGSQPLGALVEGSDGGFYGTTSHGGSHGGGVVFRITAYGKLAVLHNLSGPSDGRFPVTALVLATDGKFYGVCQFGGVTGQGTIFSVNPKNSYRFTVVYSFDGIDGAYPSALMQHTNGTLYGVSVEGGTARGCTSGCGTFFSLDMKIGPFVRLMSESGKAGQIIGIIGQGFRGTTGVSFNGKAAKFIVATDTYLTATVPKGVTNGFVIVATPRGNLVSSQRFRVQ